MNRRQFLVQAPLGLAAIRSTLSAAQSTLQNVQLTIDLQSSIATVPADMMGLSYESTQLGEPEVFSARNHQLIQLFRKLSPSGVLRLGGNTSEFTFYRSSAHITAPVYKPLPTQPAQLTPITDEALGNLRGFLEATGWSCIYGLNLGTGTPVRAADEAAAVSRILGLRLQYFQIGNEPNNYIRYKLRPSTWDVSAYFNEWLPFVQTIGQRLPTIRIGGPDMGAQREWMNVFAKRAVAALGPKFFALSDHFYAEGPPTSPTSSMDNLLRNTKIDAEIEVMQDAARVADRPIRMTEVNSCYLGGKPGVSDTFGAALWAGELSLRLVASGFSGVNFHGGSARQIKASLGGILPGDDVSNSEAADSYYTPIAGSPIHGYTARPEFYGLMLAAQFSGSNMVRISGSHPDLKAYASVTEQKDRLQLALFNFRGSTLTVNIDTGRPYHRVRSWPLVAPAVNATTGVTLAGVAAEKSSFAPNWAKEAVIHPGMQPTLTLLPFSSLFAMLHSA